MITGSSAVERQVCSQGAKTFACTTPEHCHGASLTAPHHVDSRRQGRLIGITCFRSHVPESTRRFGHLHLNLPRLLADFSLHKPSGVEHGKYTVDMSFLVLVAHYGTTLELELGSFQS